MQAALIIRLYKVTQVQSFKNRSIEKMSLKCRLAAAALAAVTVFSSAFTGAANAAESVNQDPPAQETTAEGLSAEETVREEESLQDEKEGVDPGSDGSTSDAASREEETETRLKVMILRSHRVITEAFGSASKQPSREKRQKLRKLCLQHRSSMLLEKSL